MQKSGPAREKPGDRGALGDESALPAWRFLPVPAPRAASVARAKRLSCYDLNNRQPKARSKMPEIDWSEMFTFTMSPVELFIRGTCTYFFLFGLFRFVVRRDVGAIGVSDLLVLVVIADASQNAMAGGYDSIVDGFVLIGTIIGWSYVLNLLSYHFEPVRRFVLPRPLCIVKDGVPQERHLKRELITDEELAEILREHEIENIADVRRAYLEPDGQVTVIRKRGGGQDKPRRPAEKAI
jgi:uncharacterized membrane protein YcaP (DUF421 family)